MASGGRPIKDSGTSNARSELHAFRGPDAPVQTSIAGAAVKFFLGNPGVRTLDFKERQQVHGWAPYDPVSPSRPCIHLLLLSKIPALSLSTQGTSTATRYCSIPPLLRLTTPNNPNLPTILVSSITLFSLPDASPGTTAASTSPSTSLARRDRAWRLVLRHSICHRGAVLLPRNTGRTNYPGDCVSSHLCRAALCNAGLLRPQPRRLPRRHLTSAPLRPSDTSNNVPHTLSDAILTLLITTSISSPPWACHPTLALLLVGDSFAVPVGPNLTFRRPRWPKLTSGFPITSRQWTVRWPPCSVFRWRRPFAAMSLANKTTSIGLHRPQVVGNGGVTSFGTAG